MSSKARFFLGMGLLLSFVTVVMMLFPSSPILSWGLSSTAKPVRTVKISTIVYPGSVPLYVALEKGFFEREGIQVKLVPFSAGRDGLAAVHAGQLDFCLVAELPIVLDILDGKSLAIAATIFSAERDHRVIARRDHGIVSPADLEGKTIGVTPGTTGDLVLELVLNIGKLQRQDVTIVPLKPEAMKPAILSEKLDAVSTWEPFLDSILRELNETGVVFDAFDIQGIFSVNLNLVTSKSLAENDPETVQKVLRAIMNAEAYIRENPLEAQQIATKSSGLSLDVVKKLWPGYRFEVRFDQSLVISLEDTARWAVRNRKMVAKGIPVFTDYMYPEQLSKLDPGAVRIIR
jgi:NitT/TauT family transport system substrate-binding protein